MPLRLGILSTRLFAWHVYAGEKLLTTTSMEGVTGAALTVLPSASRDRPARNLEVVHIRI